MCILTPLPTYAVVLQKVNKLLFEFLWDGKGDEIKIEFITKDHEEGGLRMIDIDIRSISPLKLPTNDRKWKFLLTLKKCMLGN